MDYRLGVDVGGTFTDVALLNTQTGELAVAKIPSTPKNPSEGVTNGIETICDKENIKTKSISNFIHGTTVATNTTLEYKGAKTALITTKGFRDLLHIGRQTRPDLYDFWERRPDPLIPRNLRFTLEERAYSKGKILKELDSQNVRDVVNTIDDRDVTSIAVCLLHSYANPTHEQEVKQIIQEEYPEAYVSISSEILPEFREYERMSTTVINAYVMPAIESYIKILRDKIHEIGVSSDLYIMQSNGGIIPSEDAMQKSASTILSGPAGGVLGGQLIANLTGAKNSITVDMGGTSFDMCLLDEGKPNYTTESEIGSHPIKLPMIDVKTIGSGGGSIAWIDKGNALRVGPTSAGADPGPVCYGKGGEEPTVTDANLVLGRLNTDSTLIGEMKIDKASEAIKLKIAEPLNLSLTEAAKGIVDVTNANMVRGIRGVSVEKGYDPRKFSLIAFGGAGPLHAVDLARELNIDEVIIPPSPGISSAIGMLTADIRNDHVRTYLQSVSELDTNNLNSLYKEMEKTASEELAEQQVKPRNMILERKADMRYKGQSYELQVQISGRNLTDEDITNLRNRFHQEHEEAYGYRIPEEEIEFVSARITALGKVPNPALKKEKHYHKKPETAQKMTREVYFQDKFVETPVFDRSKMAPGNALEGPAIIEQIDSTAVILPGQNAHMDGYKNIIIREGGE